ncbi:MAG TPA: HAMP domain-containing sensor histidine kinase [Acidobacteriota bacterium]|nr:HAMP domain-containing sensor histidine kinase [Acidobacteriota bacterium]
MLSSPRGLLWRYGIAILFSAMAFLGTLLLRPFADRFAFLLMFGGVALSLRYGGLGPGLLAAGTAGGETLFLLRRGENGGGLAALAAFLVLAALTWLFCAASERERSTVESAIRARDEFIAELSHELRTPLGAILGWTRVLRTSDLDSAATARALETIERNGRAQERLIGDLLDVSRIVSGNLRLNMAVLDPAHVVEVAVESIRPAAEAKEIRLELALAPGAGPVSGDFERLQQVMSNILSNAIKFTPNRGSIRISLASVNEGVELKVRDTGIGIPRRDLSRIFERFKQVDGTATGAGEGLGLGLAIVRHLVELHRGKVYAESEGEGCGASLTVILPYSSRES